MSQPKAAKKKADSKDSKGPRRKARSSTALKGAAQAGISLKSSCSEVTQPCLQDDDRGGELGYGGEGAEPRVEANAKKAEARRSEAAVAEAPSRLVLHYGAHPVHDVCSQFSDSESGSALKQLVLVGQPAETLAGVARLTRLTELWLVESQLQDASAARECTQLVKLVLCTNRLTEVPDLAPLSKLATLALAGNRITTVQHLGRLPALEDVNLADNLISSIGAGLVGCKRLAVLNLSGNPISSLKESRNLCGVPSLRHLSLADPVYGVTPMARLCNYRSCLLLHLPQLRTLDGFSVEPEELSQLKEFYAVGGRHMSMLRRHAEAQFLLAVRRLGVAASADLQRLRDQFFYLGQKKCEALHQRLDELSRQLQAQNRARGYLHRVLPAALAVPDYSAPAEAAAKDVEAQEGARAAENELVAELARWTDELDQQVEVHRADYEMSFAALECELESAGNVAMSVHSQGSRLANVCQDLLDRFSCGPQFAKWHIRRARVLRVTHVCSRAAEIVERWRPAEVEPCDLVADTADGVSLETPPQDGESEGGARYSAATTAAAAAARLRQDCDEGDEATEDADEGSSAERQQDSGESVESVELADCDSMFQVLCGAARELSYGPWPFRAMDTPALGAAEEPLLVSNCLALADSQWLSHRAACRGDVRGDARGDARRLAPLVRLNRGTKLRRTRWGAAAGQCGMYRVLGPRPEMLFLVEFQYEGLDEPDKHRRGAPWWRDVRTPSVKHPVLDEALLARCVACSDWGRLTSVNLAGRCIKVLGELPVLPCVTHLDLSYNQLASLGSLYAFPNLRSLNLAFNNFVTLVNMRSLPALESLNLSWNNIRHLLVVLKSLNKHAVGLRCLQVCHNPVEDVLVAAHGRHLAARYLPNLAALDAEHVREGPVFLQPPAAATAATAPTSTHGMPAGRSRSSHSALPGRHAASTHVPARPASGQAACGRTASGRLSPSRQKAAAQPQAAGHAPAQHPTHEHLPTRACGPDELRLRWRADRGDQDYVVDGVHSLVQPDRYTLSARGRGLTHVVDPGLVPWPPPVSVLATSPATAPSAPAPGTAWLAATRYADLSDNLLGEAGLTTALSAMPHLVQLDASRNAIETLPMTCLQLCPGLQRVDLSRNYLRAFPTLSGRPLHHLQFLDLSCNQLASLSGAEEMSALRELYLANNHVAALQDLQPLRKLQRLCVLDLTGNPVCEDANFKKFVVYHLRTLECVNGQEVVDGDLVAARETFGGCLDRDALLTQYTWRDLAHLVELHLPGASLRQVELPGPLLPNLEVLDLSHNSLCCLWGLQHLPRLAMLDLGHNQVRSLRGPERPRCCGDYDGYGGDGADGDEGRLFPALHTLYLDHNGLANLQPLGLGHAARLRSLFLHQNQLESLQGLGHGELRGLVLDGNHLDGAALLEAGLAGLLQHVRDLHLDGNHVHGLHGLDFLGHAGSLARLFLAKNKLTESAELEPLCRAAGLRELCLLGNPVCLRPRHFAQMRELLPELAVLDGHPMDPQRYLGHGLASPALIHLAPALLASPLASPLASAAAVAPVS